MLKRFLTIALIFSLSVLTLPVSTSLAAVDDELAKKADTSQRSAIAFLRKTQNKDGSWSPKTGPAITALILKAMIDRPDIGADDPAVKKALAYVMSTRNKDGSFHDGIIDNYNTAITLSALSRFNDQPKVAEAIKGGLNFLRGIQYTGGKDEKGHDITDQHPFYGGFGYGKHGRPDGSNTQMSIQAFFDNNIECDKDPAMKRALVFTQRLQGTASNGYFGNKIQQDGGSIYATSVNKDKVGEPQSQGGVDAEGKLRTYGSMTYAMFKTYVYARLDKKDVRVQEAMRWVSNNYTFEHNPGLPKKQAMQGYYYYLLTAARALNAYGEDTIKTSDGKKHSWRTDLVTKIVSLQRKDGSWLNEADRWLEGDPNLVTAYALLALQNAAK